MDLIAVAMADTPGLPAGVEDATKRLVNEGGITGALLVLALAAILGLWLEMRRRDSQAVTRAEAVQKEHAEQREEWQRQMEALHEKRFADMQQVMSALNSNTGALNVISQTQTDRAASTRDMSELLREVVTLARANGDTLKAMAASVQANGSAIERLLWHGGVVRAPSPPGGT